MAVLPASLRPERPPRPDVLAPLLPTLPAGPGVCLVCAGAVPAGWRRCLPCRRNADRLPATAAAVGAIAVAVSGGPLARALAGYKDAPRAATRAALADRLAELLGTWLDRHERCLAAAAGVAGFPVVTTVPSGRGRPAHPLDVLVRAAAADRWRPLLRPRPVGLARHPSADRYRASAPAGPVLVVDDTWTTGSSAQSAAAVLSAGAGPVAVLTVGRHLAVTGGRLRRAAAADYLRRAADHGWCTARCRYCADPGAPAAVAPRSVPDMSAQPPPPEVTPTEAASLLAAGALLLDVREPAEWAAGHAPPAVHLPLGELTHGAARLPADRTIVCVCHVGGRSAAAAAALRGAGRDARNLAGGMVAWARVGLPVVDANGAPGAVV